MTASINPLPSPVKPKQDVPPQLLERLHYLDSQDFEVIAQFPQPSQEDILRIVDQQIEAFAERPANHTGNAYVCRCLFELVKAMLGSRTTQAETEAA